MVLVIPSVAAGEMLRAGVVAANRGVFGVMGNGFFRDDMCHWKVFTGKLALWLHVL